MMAVSAEPTTSGNERPANTTLIISILAVATIPAASPARNPVLNKGILVFVFIRVPTFLTYDIYSVTYIDSYVSWLHSL